MYKEKPSGTGKLATIKKELASYKKEELINLVLTLAKTNHNFLSELRYYLGLEEKD